LAGVYLSIFLSQAYFTYCLKSKAENQHSVLAHVRTAVNLLRRETPNFIIRCRLSLTYPTSVLLIIQCW